jgi:hypothetical protein
MQSWEGLRRGAFHDNVYDGSRLSAVEPTRMFEDGLSEKQWREKGFVDILHGGDNSILISTLRLSKLRSETPDTPARDSMICPQTPDQIKTRGGAVAELTMPYGFPDITRGEKELLSDWVANGAPGESNLPLGLKSVSPLVRKKAQEWERFLNQQDLNSRIVARYIYEHLFLAHIYIKEEPRTFLKLIRSSTSCDQGLNRISTRRPNDAPNVKQWYYCFYRDPEVPVYKTHLPYEISSQRLAWMKDNFANPKWQATQFPSFAPEVAGNPLIAFAEIPVIARHRFLLKDAYYQVMTFIKGPVCNGSFAVNSIQDQFFVFFTEPKTDLMQIDKDYASKVAQELILPGTLRGDQSPTKIISAYSKIVEHRAKARRFKSEHLVETFPNGFSLKHIWDGDGVNDNAVLTVFRHDDNAKVVKGARGDVSKTVFLLDYSTFERLVYNLAINFDVFENVTHQLLTRLYMDILRMDAEDNFIQLLPPGERPKTKNLWYKGWLTRLKMDALDEEKFAAIPTQVPFYGDIDAKTELVQRIVFDHLNAKVRGPNDNINWKRLKDVKAPSAIEAQLRELASIPALKKISPFPRFFPELSVLHVRANDGGYLVYSIVLNREHQNVSWIFNEKSRLQSDEDTLTILPGVAGAYPNQFFSVSQKDLPQMVADAKAIRSESDYDGFVSRYGVNRMNPELWNLVDEITSQHFSLEPIEAGILDLSRYAL